MIGDVTVPMAITQRGRPSRKAAQWAGTASRALSRSSRPAGRHHTSMIASTRPLGRRTAHWAVQRRAAPQDGPGHTFGKRHDHVLRIRALVGSPDLGAAQDGSDPASRRNPEAAIRLPRREPSGHRKGPPLAKRPRLRWESSFSALAGQAGFPTRLCDCLWAGSGGARPRWRHRLPRDFSPPVFLNPGFSLGFGLEAKYGLTHAVVAYHNNVKSGLA